MKRKRVKLISMLMSCAMVFSMTSVGVIAAEVDTDEVAIEEEGDNEAEGELVYLDDDDLDGLEDDTDGTDDNGDGESSDTNADDIDLGTIEPNEESKVSVSFSDEETVIYYSSIQTAINVIAESAKSGTITLLNDLEIIESIEIPEGAVVILNLNGYEISLLEDSSEENATESSVTAVIINNGDLTIQNIVDAGDESFSDNSVITNNKIECNSLIYNDGKLIIEGGIFVADGNNISIFGSSIDDTTGFGKGSVTIYCGQFSKDIGSESYVAENSSYEESAQIEGYYAVHTYEIVDETNEQCQYCGAIKTIESDVQDEESGEDSDEDTGDTDIDTGDEGTGDEGSDSSVSEDETDEPGGDTEGTETEDENVPSEPFKTDDTEENSYELHVGGSLKVDFTSGYDISYPESGLTFTISTYEENGQEYISYEFVFDEEGTYEIFVYNKESNEIVAFYTVTVLPVEETPDEQTHTEHEWNEGEVIKDATCTEDGEIKYTCTICGETYTEVISATGHSWNAGEITTDPTYTSVGEITYTCEKCGATYTEEVDMLVCPGHEWDEGIITVSPTTESTGEITYTCTICGETYTEILPALDSDDEDGDEYLDDDVDDETGSSERGDVGLTGSDDSDSDSVSSSDTSNTTKSSTTEDVVATTVSGVEADTQDDITGYYQYPVELAVGDSYTIVIPIGYTIEYPSTGYTLEKSQDTIAAYYTFTFTEPDYYVIYVRNAAKTYTEEYDITVAEVTTIDGVYGSASGDGKDETEVGKDEYGKDEVSGDSEGTYASDVSSSGAHTGDESHAGLWIILICIAGGGCVAIVAVSRRRING